MGGGVGGLWYKGVLGIESGEEWWYIRPVGVWSE